jgi:hypothetical protein
MVAQIGFQQLTEESLPILRDNERLGDFWLA